MNRFFIFCFGFACAEPFQTDRHYLDSFRIIEASVHNGVADAVIWSGEGAFHRTSPQLQWLVDGEVVGEGYGADVPLAERYELEVLSPAGNLYFADVISGVALSEPEITRFVWSEQENQEYSIEERSSASLDERAMVNRNDVIRLQTDEQSVMLRHRWSADGGTILELSASSTDLFFDTLHFEEGALTHREEGKKDRVHVFLLTIDNNGGTSTKWIDVDFSGIEPVLYNQMILPLSESLLSGIVQLDVRMTDEGYLFENPTSLEEVPQEPSHECMSGAIFDMNWIRQGRCSLTELDGLSIILEVP